MSHRLFGNVSDSRVEVVFEVSSDGARWDEVVVGCRPGRVTDPAPLVPLLQASRLDWLMFSTVSLGRCENIRWVMGLLEALLRPTSNGMCIATSRTS